MTWALVEVLSTCDKDSTWDQCLTSLREKLRNGGYPQFVLKSKIGIFESLFYGSNNIKIVG